MEGWITGFKDSRGQGVEEKPSLSFSPG